MGVWGNSAFVKSLQLLQEWCVTGSFFGKRCIDYIGQNVSKWSIGAVAGLYWRHSLKNLLDYMRSGGPLRASTLAQLWDATMQNRNLKNAYFFAVFREKPSGGIGQISCSKIQGEVLWILCDFWGTLRVSEESHRSHAYGSLRRQEQHHKCLGVVGIRYTQN